MNEAQDLSKADLHWCVRRLPEPVRNMLKVQGPRFFVAGGYIRSCIANERVSDIDVFGPSKDACETAAKDLLSVVKGGRLFRSDNAFTVHGLRFPVQFIHRWTFDSPEVCLQSFDFTIARAAIWSAEFGFKGICDHRFYEHMASKKLVYCRPVRNEDAGGSLLRVLKFYQRGYRIPLDSLGAVVARLSGAVLLDGPKLTEERLAQILTGLLVEVDPNAFIETSTHLPSEDGDAGVEEQEEITEKEKSDAETNAD